MIHTFDPQSVKITFGGVTIDASARPLIIEENPRRGMSFGHVSMTMIATGDEAKKIGRFVNRLFPYLTPRKRRRIKRRAERGYLNRMATDWYGLALHPDESTASLRDRCKEMVKR